MRLLFVAQRYGLEVAGGAELHCRQFATRLAERGHEVHVATSCARSYVDWANVYPAGTEEIEGVTVHRIPVASPRDDVVFQPLNERVVWGPRPIPLYLQEAWMTAQGPYMPELPSWLLRHGRGFDVIIFFTYLYWPTWAGLPAAASVAPTVLHPTAHDEPPLYLPLFDIMFRVPRAFAFSVEEERTLVAERFGLRAPHGVIGIGMELKQQGDASAFREKFGLHDRPYLLFVGRLDPGKGSVELYDHFVEYKSRNRGDLALVLLGDPVYQLPPHPDVVVTGYVDDATRDGAMAGMLALAQPSYFESFSMVLTEAWMHGRPALVQGHCDVLVGQTARARGGLPYRSFGEFEAALDLLFADPDLASSMGESGRRYVEERYPWDRVLGRYERLLEVVRGTVGAR